MLSDIKFLESKNLVYDNIIYLSILLNDNNKIKINM